MDHDDYMASRLEREREIEEILLSQDTPISKVQHIMQLGIEEEAAEELVERYQIGQTAPVYYERLYYYDDLS